MSVVEPNERAAFLAWLGIKPIGAAHEFAWQAWKARAALVANFKPITPSEFDEIWEQAERSRHPMTSVAYQMAYAVEQEVLRRLGLKD